MNLRTCALASFLLATAAAAAESSAALPPETQRALLDLKGYDFGKLPPQAQRELATLLSDEFDYCGRPLTLMAALKKPDVCRHTQRLVRHAASRLSDGSTAQEVLAELARYQASFTRKRATFKVDERQCMGSKTAALTLVEFSDFECPYCALARPILEQFVKDNPDARLCYAPFPLSGHPHAMLAGRAVLFARDHGKFWPMHDALFENQASISEVKIKALLAGLKLDVKAFEKLLGTEKYLDELKDSRAAGIAAGVVATPSVFANGRLLELGLSPASLRLALEEEAEWSATRGKWP